MADPNPAGRRNPWASGTLLRDTWGSLRAELGAIPGRCWYRWGAALAGGFVACTALTYGVTRAARGWSALPGIDARALDWLIGVLPMQFADAIMYESPGNLLYIGPLILVVSVLWIRRGAAVAALSLFIGYLLQRPLVLLGWYWWDRARPESVAGGVASPAMHSFPSGHAALSTFAYGFLAYLWWRSTRNGFERVVIVLLTVAWLTMINAGRLRLGTHWPSDTVAGLLIALPWLAVVAYCHRYLEGCRGE